MCLRPEGNGVEFRNTKELTIVQWMLQQPVLSMFITSLGPMLLITIALMQSVDIDTSIESFRIRDHPVAENEDALHGARKHTSIFWNKYEANENQDRRKHLRKLHCRGGSPCLVEEYCSGYNSLECNHLMTSENSSDSLFMDEDVSHGFIGVGGNQASHRSLLNLPEEPRRLYTKWRLHVLYSFRNGSSIWTPDAMRWIQAFEHKIMSHPDYNRTCLHLRKSEGSRVCRPPNSVINYVFPSVIVTDAGTQVVYDGKGNRMGSLFSVGSRLLLQDQMWYVDGKADLSNGAVGTLRTDFLFGVPVDGFVSETDNFHQQEQLYKNLMKDLYPVLKGANNEYIRVNYGGEFLTDHEIKQELFQDCKRIGWGFAAIMAFAWWHTKSLFITAVGLLEIVASLPIAYFFHRVVQRIPTVNVIQFLGLFIILGIGIDDVFVFFDTYCETLQLHSEFHPIIRLSHAYRRAGAAMAVTSFTSAIAFAANVISAIPAVRTFGAFLATMVAVNYFLVMTWFPACIAFWEKYSVQRRLHTSQCDNIFCSILFGPKLKKDRRPISLARKNIKFWWMHSWVVYKLRWALLPALAIFSACGMYGMTLLKGSDSVPAIFPEDHNVQTFLDLWESEFLSSGSCDRCWRDFQNPRSGDVAPEVLASFAIFPSNSGNSADLQHPTSNGQPSPHQNSDNTPGSSIGSGGSENQTTFSAQFPPPLAASISAPMHPNDFYLWGSPPSISLSPPPPSHPLSTADALRQLVEGFPKIERATPQSLLLWWNTTPTLPALLFSLEMREAGNVRWEEVYRGNATNHDIKGMDAGDQCELRLRAVSGLEEALGDTVVARISSMRIPLQPDSIYLMERTPVSLRVEWNSSQEPNGPIDGFWVAVSPTSGDSARVTYKVNGKQTSMLLGPLKSSSSYNVSVSAFNDMGSSSIQEVVFQTMESSGKFKSSGRKFWSNHLDRDVRLLLIDATEAWVPSGRRLLADAHLAYTIYAIIPATVNDELFPTPYLMEGNQQGDFLTSIESGAGKSAQVAQEEDNLGAMYSRFSDETASEIQPVVITTIEKLPGDDGDHLSKWLAEDLVGAIDAIYGVSNRSQRAIMGFGASGGLAAVETGFTAMRPFRGVALLNSNQDPSVANAGDLVHHLNAQDIFLYIAGRNLAGGSLPCRILAGMEISELLEGTGKCNILEEEDEDLFRVGVKAFEFLNMVFSLESVEDKVTVPQPRLNTIRVSLVWGIQSVDRSMLGGDPFSISHGDPVYMKGFDVTQEDSQAWILHVCDTIHSNMDLIEAPDRCFMKAFKDWVIRKGNASEDAELSFPVPQKRMARELWEFMKSYRKLYEQDVGYVMDGHTRSMLNSAHPLAPKWVRITAKSKVDNRASSHEGHEEWVKWDQAVTGLNKAAPFHTGPMRQTSELWLRIWTEREVVDSTKWAIIIAGGCALISIVVFTGNLWMALFVLANLVCILCVMLGFFHVIGWRMGAIEAISVTILVGLSVDFALHICEAYSKSEANSRSQRTIEAIQRMGSPIVAAAFTTAMACMPLILATILILKFFGIVVVSSILLSVIFGLYFLCPMLMVMGPNKGDQLPCLPQWGKKTVELCFGTAIRRASLLSTLAVGIVASFKLGQDILLEQKWILYVAAAVVVTMVTIESSKAYKYYTRKYEKDNNLGCQQMSTTEMMKHRSQRDLRSPRKYTSNGSSSTANLRMTSLFQSSMTGRSFCYCLSENAISKANGKGRQHSQLYSESHSGSLILNLGAANSLPESPTASGKDLPEESQSHGENKAHSSLNVGS